MIDGLNNATTQAMNQVLLRTDANAGKSQLDGLKDAFSDPKSVDGKKLKKAAQEFEAIFLQQLLDAMDKTVMKDEDSLLTGSEAEKSFRGMLNQNIATNIATGPGGSGLGLAETIYKQTIMTMNQEQVKDAMEQQQHEMEKRVDVQG